MNKISYNIRMLPEFWHRNYAAPKGIETKDVGDIARRTLILLYGAFSQFQDSIPSDKDLDKYLTGRKEDDDRLREGLPIAREQFEYVKDKFNVGVRLLGTSSISFTKRTGDILIGVGGKQKYRNLNVRISQPNPEGVMEIDIEASTDWKLGFEFRPDRSLILSKLFENRKEVQTMYPILWLNNKRYGLLNSNLQQNLRDLTFLMMQSEA